MAATGDGGFHATEDFAEPILPAQRQEEEGGSHSVAEPDVLPQPPVYSPEIFSTLTPAEAALIFSPSLVAIAALPAPPDEAPMARTGPRALSVCHEGDDSLGLPSDGVLDDSEVAPVPGASAPADLIGADEERRAKLQALALELPKSSVTKEAAQMFATVDPRFAEDENPKERIQREDTGTSGFFRRHESSLTRRESSGASAFGASIKRVVGSGAVEAPQRWSAKTGPDKVRRALMMDKAGAVARALGQPGAGFSAHMLKKERSFQKHADNDTTVQRERSLERSHAKSHTLSLGNLSHLFTRFLSQSKVSGRPELTAHQVIIFLASMLMLFGYDAYYISNPSRETDVRMQMLLLMVLAIVLIEFAANCLFSAPTPSQRSQGKFVNSFFFWVDLIAIFSLVPDLFALWEVNILIDSSTLRLARAGRAAKAGARVAWLYRAVLSPSPTSQTAGGDSGGEGGASGEGQGDGGNGSKELKVGRKVLVLISQRVIGIVGAMLITTSVLMLLSSVEEDFGAVPTRSASVLRSLRMVSLFFAAGGNDASREPFATAAHDLVSLINVGLYSDAVQVARDMEHPEHSCPAASSMGTAASRDASLCTLRYLRLGNATLWGSPESWEELRVAPSETEAWVEKDGEFIRIEVHTDEGKRLVASSSVCLVVSRVQPHRTEAVRSVVTVFVIAVLLGVSSALLGRDIDMLVIEPLETMARMVTRISKDPMSRVSHEDTEYLRKSDGETRTIVEALIKCSALLQMGFGEAGSSIIGNNLAMSTGTNIVPIIPGKRMMGIFGFCDVRNFTVATECLQEDIMIYINCIAEYVHAAVHDNGGFPNKNVGDAWLLSWPVADDSWTRTTSDHDQQKPSQDKAESALRSFLRVIIETSCSHVLRRLGLNAKLLGLLPGYTTQLGFGLHVGWAIEGAIGSELKVDPSYLSSNVEMSQILEGATKHYGMSVLMTDTFYDMLPPTVQRLCRCVDKVKTPAIKVPMDLWTYDLTGFGVEQGRLPVISNRQASTFWEQFPPYTTEAFRAQFDAGFKCYTEGDWREARSILESCLQLMPDDRPTQQLLQVMEKSNFQVPVTWKGFRETDSNSLEIQAQDDDKLARFWRTTSAADATEEEDGVSTPSKGSPRSPWAKLQRGNASHMRRMHRLSSEQRSIEDDVGGISSEESSPGNSPTGALARRRSRPPSIEGALSISMRSPGASFRERLSTTAKNAVSTPGGSSETPITPTTLNSPLAGSPFTRHLADSLSFGGGAQEVPAAKRDLDIEALLAGDAAAGLGTDSAAGGAGAAGVPHAARGVGDIGEI